MGQLLPSRDDDLAVHRVIEDVSDLVDAYFGFSGRPPRMTVAPLSWDLATRKLRDGTWEHGFLGEAFADRVTLRTTLLQGIATFLRGDISSGNPVVAALELTALSDAVKGLEVLIHEKVHHVQFQQKSRCGRIAYVPRRQITEGLTQLTALRLLSPIIEGLGWNRLDPRLPRTSVGSRFNETYPAEVAALTRLLEWAEPAERARQMVTRDATRVALDAGSAAWVIVNHRYGEGRAIPSPIHTDWFEPLSEIRSAARDVFGRTTVPANERRQSGSGLADEVIRRTEAGIADVVNVRASAAQLNDAARPDGSLSA